MANDDQDNSVVSPDDILEDSRSDRLMGSDFVEPLEGDYETPASPSNSSSLPLDHPSLDTGLDPSEVYEKGEDGAAHGL